MFESFPKRVFLVSALCYSYSFVCRRQRLWSCTACSKGGAKTGVDWSAIRAEEEKA